MSVFDLMMDLRNANGDKEKEAEAHAAFEQRKQMAQTPGEAATKLLRDCVGPDGKPLLSSSERVELVGDRLVTTLLN